MVKIGFLPLISIYNSNLLFFKNFIISKYGENYLSMCDINIGEYYFENCTDNYYVNGLRFYSDGDFIYTLTNYNKILKYGE